jgi:pimeloyl-ACP methyl ester carboxylesterase
MEQRRRPLGTQSPGKAMEAAVMSLSAREQQALDSIEDGLSGADPKLASLLATFTRLTAELPVLRDLLPQIQTPVQIIAGGHDTAVPPVNAEFLHERLPYSKLDIIDAGHFTWEDAADTYAALVTTWWSGGYATTGSAAAH